MKNILIAVFVLSLSPTAFGFMGIGNLQAQKSNTPQEDLSIPTCESKESVELQKAQLELLQIQIKVARKQLQELEKQDFVPKPTTVRMKCVNQLCSEVAPTN